VQPLIPPAEIPPSPPSPPAGQKPQGGDGLTPEKPNPPAPAAKDPGLDGGLPGLLPQEKALPAPKPQSNGAMPSATGKGNDLAPATPNGNLPGLTPDAAPLPKPEATPLLPPDAAPPAPKSSDHGGAVKTSCELPLQADWGSALYPESLQQGGPRVAQLSEVPAEAKPPAALGGFSPVALCEHERWLAGDPQFEAVYRERTYLFRSDEERRRFLNAPGDYVPACAGNDPVLAVEEARSVPGTLTRSALWNGRLYLFTSSATLAQFREEPDRYAKATAGR
jgi:YHS domain-containing protein